jgi:hypothetical protein
MLAYRSNPPKRRGRPLRISVPPTAPIETLHDDAPNQEDRELTSAEIQKWIANIETLKAAKEAERESLRHYIAGLDLAISLISQ